MSIQSDILDVIADEHTLLTLKSEKKKDGRFVRPKSIYLCFLTICSLDFLVDGCWFDYQCGNGRKSFSCKSYSTPRTDKVRPRNTSIVPKDEQKVYLTCYLRLVC